MKYGKVRKTPTQLLSLTGFTEVDFKSFVPCFEYHRQEHYFHYTLAGKGRQ